MDSPRLYAHQCVEIKKGSEFWIQIYKKGDHYLIVTNEHTRKIIISRYSKILGNKKWKPTENNNPSLKLGWLLTSQAQVDKDVQDFTQWAKSYLAENQQQIHEKEYVK